MQIIWTGIFGEFLLFIAVIRSRLLDAMILSKAYAISMLGPKTFIWYSFQTSGLSNNVWRPTKLAKSIVLSLDDRNIKIYWICSSTDILRHLNCINFRLSNNIVISILIFCIGMKLYKRIMSITGEQPLGDIIVQILYFNKQLYFTLNVKMRLKYIRACLFFVL